MTPIDTACLRQAFSGASERIRAHAECPEGQALKAHMESDVAWFAANFSDDPKTESGWGHAYFCPKDGAFLTFDRESPDAHRCPVCGAVSRAPLHNAAWVYLYRYEAVMSAYEAAILYQAGAERACLEHCMRILGFYSSHYAEFVPHARGPATSGQGKIAPQALNEAIFLVRIAQTLELVRDALPPEFVRSVCEQLLILGARFLKEQCNWINNIPCWINAAMTAAGCLCGEEELIRAAFDGPFGMYRQAEQGVTESGFWFEGSIHYNCFTLEAFLNQLMFAAQHGVRVRKELAQTVAGMVDAVHSFAFSNTVLPNPNDGWPNLNLKTYSYLFEMASALFGTEHFRAMAETIYRSPVTRTPLPMSFPIYEGDFSAEWMMFAHPATASSEAGRFARSVCFSASDCAILKNRNCEVFVKYGHCTPSHAHPDKMNLEVTAFGTVVSRDLSNCGYASRLCDEYYRTSVSHNTVVIDGENHPGTERGECVNFDESVPSVRVRARDAYPGVHFERDLTVLPDGMLDTFRVSSDIDHTVDWVFHVEGTLAELPETLSGELGFDKNGYQHLQDVRRVSGQTCFTLRWEFGEGRMHGTQTLCADGAELYLCRSYDNPANRFRNTLILRVRGRDACFEQKWNFERTEP